MLKLHITLSDNFNRAVIGDIWDASTRGKALALFTVNPVLIADHSQILTSITKVSPICRTSTRSYNFRLPQRGKSLLEMGLLDPDHFCKCSSPS